MNTTIQSQVLDSFSVAMSDRHTCTLEYDDKIVEITFLQYQWLSTMRTDLAYAYQNGDNATIALHEKVLSAWLPTLVA